MQLIPLLQDAQSNMTPQPGQPEYDALLRAATIGRLTTSLVHNLYNRMQAVQGSFALAQESLDEPELLRSFIEVGRQESERAMRLIDRVREIYRPSFRPPEKTDLVVLLREIIDLAREDLAAHSLTPRPEPPAQATAVICQPAQVMLAILSVLLDLATLHPAQEQPQPIIFQIIPADPTSTLRILCPPTLPAPPSVDFARTLVAEQNGRLTVQPDPNGCQIELTLTTGQA